MKKNLHWQEVFFTKRRKTHIGIATRLKSVIFLPTPHAMTYEEIPSRMHKLGVDRTWLAKQCDYTPDSLRQILAPKGKSKTNKALRRIWEVLDREDQRQSAEAAAPELPAISSLVLRVDAAEFDDWNRAAMVKGKLVSEWAIDSIREAYAEQNGLKVADDPPDFRSDNGKAG